MRSAHKAQKCGRPVIAFQSGCSAILPFAPVIDGLRLGPLSRSHAELGLSALEWHRYIFMSRCSEEAIHQLQSPPLLRCGSRRDLLLPREALFYLAWSVPLVDPTGHSSGASLYNYVNNEKVSPGRQRHLLRVRPQQQRHQGGAQRQDRPEPGEDPGDLGGVRSDLQQTDPDH